MTKILIVDDSPTIVGIVKTILEEHHYEVVTATDGEEGLKKAREILPDLIILDIMLPKIEGYNICRLLKFDGTYEHIPIILFTAKTGEEDRKIGESVGANDYITKDFDPSQLIDLIEKHLKKE